MSLRARLAGFSEAAMRLLLVAAVLLFVAVVPAKAAKASGTTPSPEPLWKAYPLNAGQPPTQRSPAPATTPRTGATAPSRSGGLRLALEITATLAGVLAVGGGLVVYIRSRQGRQSDAAGGRRTAGVVVAPAAADVRSVATLRENERPRPAERDQLRPLLGGRGREVVSDLLETLGGQVRRSPAVPTADEELILGLCKRMRSATRAGDIEWYRAGADRFVWERAVGSLAIRSLNGDAQRRYELVVHDWNGTTLDALQSPLPGANDAAALTDAFAGVYAVASDSASRLYEPIDTLIDALRGSPHRP